MLQWKVGHCMWRPLWQYRCASGLSAAWVYIRWVDLACSCEAIRESLEWSGYTLFPLTLFFPVRTSSFLVLLVTHILSPLSLPSFPGAYGQGRALFGPGTGPIFLDNLRCHGGETRLLQCNNDGVGFHNCVHSEDASAVCIGDISILHASTFGCMLAFPIICVFRGVKDWGTTYTHTTYKCVRNWWSWAEQPT